MLIHVSERTRPWSLVTFWMSPSTWSALHNYKKHLAVKISRRKQTLLHHTTFFVMFIRLLGRRAFSTSIRGIGKHDQDVGALQNLMRMVNDIEAYMNPLATADFKVHVRWGVSLSPPACIRWRRWRRVESHRHSNVKLIARLKQPLLSRVMRPCCQWKVKSTSMPIWLRAVKFSCFHSITHTLHGPPPPTSLRIQAINLINNRALLLHMIKTSNNCVHRMDYYPTFIFIAFIVIDPRASRATWSCWIRNNHPHWPR